MDFKAFSQNFSEKTSSEYHEYDDNHSIFVVPLPDDRFQTVVARLVHHDKYNREVVQVTSKVCDASQQIDYPKILEASKDFIHTNFIVEDGFLRVGTSIFLEFADDKLIEEMIREVAFTADDWEFKITGQDNF